MIRGRVRAWIVPALALACGASTMDRVPEGSWGGEHVGLLVGPAGAAVDLDCAHGAITAPMRLDADGGFSLPGYYVWDVGPPQVPEDRRAATYSGRSDGRSLTLSFTLVEGGESGGPFTAFPGAPAQVRECR